MQKFLKQYDFAKAGEIDLRANDMRPVFFLLEKHLQGALANAYGWVYVWIAFRSETMLNVCYVGQAHQTLKSQCDQHIHGFRGGSEAGVQLAEQICDFLNDDENHRLEVHARRADTAAVLGETDISLCDAEQHAMLKKLRALGQPLWNMV